MRLSHVILNKYCKEIDKLYNIKDADIILWSNDHTAITINQNPIKTHIYVPFSYKEIPVQLKK